MLKTIVAIGAALIVIGASLILIGKLYRMYQAKKALNGEYGDSTQWAAELVGEDNDEHFALAVQALPNNQLRELGIIAESKEELREITIERFEEEVSNEQIPEDFA